MKESLKELVLKSPVYKWNTRFKNLTIYFTLVTVCVVLWTQLDSLQLHYKTQPVVHVPFTSSEMDPATWSIQLEENELNLVQPSIFPNLVFDSTLGYPSVTAVVNRVDDSHDGIRQVVLHLLKYPFIKEILVYNQIRSKPLIAEVRQERRAWHGS